MGLLEESCVCQSSILMLECSDVTFFIPDIGNVCSLFLLINQARGLSVLLIFSNFLKKPIFGLTNFSSLFL